MERAPSEFGFVAAGGVVGAVGRHAVDVAIGDATGTGTFLVNVVGSFVLGLLVTRTVDKRIQLFVGTGVIASFTTYSTFAADAVALGTVGGATYTGATYAAGLSAAAVGLVVGRRT